MRVPEVCPRGVGQIILAPNLSVVDRHVVQAHGSQEDGLNRRLWTGGCKRAAVITTQTGGDRDGTNDSNGAYLTQIVRFRVLYCGSVGEYGGGVACGRGIKTVSMTRIGQRQLIITQEGFVQNGLACAKYLG